MKYLFILLLVGMVGCGSNEWNLYNGNAKKLNDSTMVTKWGDTIIFAEYYKPDSTIVICDSSGGGIAIGKDATAPPAFIFDSTTRTFKKNNTKEIK